jgi:transposase InsO family protein
VRGASGNWCPYRDSQHWELIVATDFFTVEVWTRRGLQRFMVLFFIELSTRKVQIAGIASTANGLWMSQMGRNLTDAEQGILTGKRYLIHDRDPLFTAEFWRMIADAGVESVKLPPRSPNLNAHAERFVRSIKESCLDRLIFFGEDSLRTAIQNFVPTITGNAITKAWGTVSSAQSLATSATQVKCNAGSGWAACWTTTTAPLPELKIPEREFTGVTSRRRTDAIVADPTLLGQ